MSNILKFPARSSEPTIFIVEDDDIDSMALQRAFNRVSKNLNVIRARDGIEALDLLNGTDTTHPLFAPDAMVIDLNMPRMNGTQLLDQIRGNSRFNNTKIFILSGSDSDADIIHSYESDIASYIVKSSHEDSITKTANLVNYYLRCA